MRSDTASANVLVWNCGSSSLKYKIIRMPDETELVNGEAERIGIKTAGTPFITHTVKGKKRVVECDMPDHAAAFAKAVSLIDEDNAVHGDVLYHAFAHRFVHPGNQFNRTMLVDRSVLTKLAATMDLAPIHNPMSYGLIACCDREKHEVPQYVIFDTAFHRTIPEAYAAYALPAKMMRKYGIRKYGFHGISHEYVSMEAVRFLGRDAAAQKIISCHLGTGGASVCAIDGGRSVQSSMGFTPLEGLIMNTRSGDIDIGVVLSLMFSEGRSVDEIETMLNKKSGVLGIDSATSDLRDVMKRLPDVDARTTLTMYVRRIKKYIGYYSLLLKKADILIFTDSLGVSSSLIRERVCTGMDIFGIQMNVQKNSDYAGGIADVSTTGSDAAILVLPTDEEIMIAREAYREYCRDNELPRVRRSIA